MVPHNLNTLAAVRCENGATAQRVFAGVIARWGASYRIAGVLEEGYGRPDRMRGAGHLRNIADGRHFPIFQGLGTESRACQVDAVGATSACSAVLHDIADGCDLLLLSKFGRLESEGQGLMPALLAAMEKAIPVLIYVPAKFEAAWHSFADPLSVMLPADAAEIENWWRPLRSL